MRTVSAIILAGGKGLRMESDLPNKCLSKVRGKPIIRWAIDSVYRHVDDLILCIGHGGQEVLEETVSYMKTKPIATSNQGEDATIAERIHAAFDFVSDLALICYGDTYADVDIPELLKTHQRLNAQITMTVVPYESDSGIITEEDGRVVNFMEKPTLPGFFKNIGYILIEKQAAERLKHMTFQQMLHEAVWPNEPGLAVYHHDGKHATVNTEKDRVEAEELLR